MAAEQQLSPEEKLLKVIQNGGKKDSAAAKPAAAATAAAAVKPQVTDNRQPTTDNRPEITARASGQRKPEENKDPVKQPVAGPSTSRSEEVGAGRASPSTSLRAGKAEAAGAKPKLKVAKSEEDAKVETAKIESAKAALIDSAKGEREAASAPVGGQTARPPLKKRAGRKLNMMTLNFWLGAAVLLVICLSGYEIWAGIQTVRDTSKTDGPKHPPTGAQPAQHLQQVQVPYDITNVLEIVEKRPILKIISGTGVVGDDKKPIPAPDWVVYVKDNYRLSALLGGKGKKPPEAVIMDSKQSKMIFLKIGDKVSIGDQKISLKRIENDLVVLTDGGRDQAVK